MAERGPWEDYQTKADEGPWTSFPSPAASSRTPYAEETEPPDTSFFRMGGRRLGRTAKGMAKTVTGLGVGAGQILSDLDATRTLSKLGETAPAQAISHWARSPATSVAEEVGGFLPYLVGRGGPAGAVLGGLTPTESGSLPSHFLDTLLGGTGSAVLGRAGGYIPKLPHYWHLMHLIPGAGTLAWLTAQLARQGLNAPPVRAARSAVAREAPTVSTGAIRKATEDNAQ